MDVANYLYSRLWTYLVSRETIQAESLVFSIERAQESVDLNIRLCRTLRIKGGVGNES